jgi:hypothetical protein
MDERRARIAGQYLPVLGAALELKDGFDTPEEAIAALAGVTQAVEESVERLTQMIDKKAD